MKRLVFMNHRIREPGNTKPVITVQVGKRQRQAHAVEIRDRRGELVATVAWSPDGTPHVTTHQVKAWVEIENHAQVELRRDFGKSPSGKAPHC